MPAHDVASRWKLSLLVAALAVIPRIALAQGPGLQPQAGETVLCEYYEFPIQWSSSINHPTTTRRPALLPALYGSYIGLQALDIHSTHAALTTGAGREGNPLLTGVAHNSAGLIALKAASTAAVIWGSEKLRKKNRAAAVLLMVGVNTATAVVVARNYRVARHP